MKVDRRQDYGIVLQRDNRYKVIRLDYPRRLETFNWRGRRYAVSDQRKRQLIGWRPLKRRGFLSDLLDKDGVTRTVEVYLEPSPDSPDGYTKPILSLDRLTQNLSPESLTPQIHRTYFVSNLYAKRMSKLRIGGVNMTIVVVAIIIGGIILAMLYLSGYFGG